MFTIIGFLLDIVCLVILVLAFVSYVILLPIVWIASMCDWIKEKCEKKGNKNKDEIQ